MSLPDILLSLSWQQCHAFDTALSLIRINFLPLILNFNITVLAQHLSFNIELKC